MNNRLKCLVCVLISLIMVIGTAFADVDVSEPTEPGVPSIPTEPGEPSEPEEPTEPTEPEEPEEPIESDKPLYVLEYGYSEDTGDFVLYVYLENMPTLIAGGSFGLEFAERLGEYTFKCELPSIEMFYDSTSHKHFFSFAEAEVGGDAETLGGIDAREERKLLCTYTFHIERSIAAGITKDSVTLLKFDGVDETSGFDPEVIDDVWKYDEDGIGCYQGVPFEADGDGKFDDEETFCIYFESKLRESAGVSVFGKVRSYDPKKVTTAELISSDDPEVSYTATVSETSGKGRTVQSFVFTDVAAGSYTLKLTKPSHLSYTKKSVVVGDEDVDLSGLDGADGDTAVLLCGDINGDGYIKLNDRSMLLSSTYFGKKVESDDAKKYDLDGDGYVKLNDLNIMMQTENFNKKNVVMP